MQDIEQELREGLIKLQPLIALARIKEDYYSLPSDMSKVEPAYLEEAQKWIRRTLETIFADWRMIRKQQSEDRWRWCLELDKESFQNHREVLIHNETVRAARKWLYTKFRPDLFKKGHHSRILIKETPNAD